jgi:hypothetical protein
MQGDNLRRSGLIFRSALLMLVSSVLAAAVLSGGVPDIGANANAHDGQLRLTLREDLTVRAETNWPVFVEIGSDGASSIAVTIDGPGLDKVDARTFPDDARSGPLSMSKAGGSLTGAVPVGSSSTLLMLTFAQAGTYRVAAEAVGQKGGAVYEVAISDNGRPTFGAPTLGPWAGGWKNETNVGEELGFALSAPIDRWGDTPWGTYYNWTISVVCPTGMEVGGDLSVYNTGDTRVDRSALESTSAISAWENGFNTVFYTAWDGDGGNVLSGTAAMTPNAKELTTAAGTYDEWTKELWAPSGAGTLTFNDPGHYLVIIHLSDADGPVSPPLVLETVVS